MDNYGTIVQSPIRPPSSADRFPTAHSIELLGGLKVVRDYEDLASIPVERLNTSSLAFVLSLNTFFKPTIVGTSVTWAVNNISTITPITYSNLLIALSDGALSAYTHYLLVDYKTTHFYNYIEVNTEVSSIYEGDLEPLILYATSSSTISKEVISTIYPEDIIHYTPDSGVVAGDRAFSYRDEGFEIISTFKGLIYYREDTAKKLSAHFDFRGVINSRYDFQADTYSSGTTYSKTSFVTYSGYIYKSTCDNNIRNTPGTTSNYWVKLINLSVLKQAPKPTLFEGITTTTSPYLVSTFNDYCYNISLGKKTIEYNLTSSILPNIVFLGKAVNVQIEGSLVENVGVVGETNFNNITFGANCENVKIGYNFRDCLIGADFKNNDIGYEFRNNIIGANCRYNVIKYGFNVNYIGENFRYNHILNYFNSNTIGYSFYYNTCNYFFRFNDIGYACQYNSFLQLFAYNIILSTFKYNSVQISVQNHNFTSNAAVAALYSKLVLSAQDSSIKVLSINSDNSINITNG